MQKDYYKILGVEKGANDDEIKRAYRKLAHKHHPDKGNGNDEKFKEINEAYQILSDKQKRQQYDQFGQTFDGAGGFGGAQGFQGFQGFQGQGMNFDFNDLGDIFGDVFGGRGSRQAGPVAGADIQMELVIPFDEAVRGGSETVELYRSAKCSKCQGNGAEPGTKIKTCEKCGGQGQVQTQSQTMFGAFSRITVCPDCRGEGKIPEKPCSRCGGDGISKETEKMTIKIPAGIDNNGIIRVTGKGEAGRRGGPAGDLYIKIRVKEDKEFQRQGENIITEAPISITQAVLGDKIKVKTLEGEVLLKIPAGTQSEKVFILRGKGVQRLQASGKGDHLVKVMVVTPKKLSKDEKRLFEELASLSGQSQKIPKTLFEKVKKKLRGS